VPCLCTDPDTGSGSGDYATHFYRDAATLNTHRIANPGSQHIYLASGDHGARIPDPGQTNLHHDATRSPQRRRSAV
jgi:hypothetical protein